jgi:hypothetical protein
MHIPPIICQQEIRFQWTRELAKRRARCFLSRTSWRLAAFLSVVALVIGIVGFLVDHRPEKRVLYWILIGFPLIPYLVYGRPYLSRVRVKPRDLNRQITVRIGVDGITVDGGEIANNVRWSGIKRLWKSSDLFLLFTDTQRPIFITLPIVELTDETRTFIETKIKEHGGQVA